MRRAADGARTAGATWPALRRALLGLAAGVVLGAAPAAAQDSVATVQVEGFRVEGATLVAPQRIDAVLAPYRGARSLLELRRAADAVQRLYAEEGWGGVVAYVPPQTAADGSVTIQVVEGKLGRIRVRGASDAAAEAAVRAAVPDLVLGQTPRLRTVDVQLQIANENAARQIQLLLGPGDRQGEIAAELSVRQSPPLTLALLLDDTGNDRTGRWRASAIVQHADLSGAGDVGTFFVQTSPTEADKFAVASAAYRRPLPGWLGVVEGYAAYSDIDGGSSPTAAGSVRINGRGSVFGLRGTRYLPRAGELDQRVAATLERREYLNRCDVENLPPAACGGAGVDVAVAPLSLEYSLRSSDRLAWGLTLGAAYNVGAGGQNAQDTAFEASRPGAEVHYTALRAAASARGDFGGDPGWRWAARFNAQWTRDALVSGEQFGIGGASSVRGYEERELVGDRGMVASLELTTPEWLERERSSAPSLRGFAFVDGGVVANLLDTPCREQNTRCPAASTGLGLAFEYASFQLRLTGAVALKDGAQTRSHDTRAHVAAQLMF